MKKICALLFLLFCINSAHAAVSEVFEGMDENYVKAGISKYILTRGGKINHGESYSSNLIQAIDYVYENNKNVIYVYNFKITPDEAGAKLDLIVLKKAPNNKWENTSLDVETKTMARIKSSIKGRLLYGLGFDFELYDTSNGKIKAPKGKETGVILTAVRYDALKQGLQAGDVIIEVNGVLTKDIPIEEFASIFFAKNMTDSLTLKYRRNTQTGTVVIKPRLSNTKVF